MLPQYIDDRGEVWSAHSKELSAQLDTHRTGDALKPIAVGSLGFIHLARVGKLVHVTMDRQSVTQMALCGLLYWASDNEGACFLVHTGRAQPPQLVPNFRQMLKLVDDVCGGRSDETTYREQPIDVDKSIFATRWAAAREIVGSIGASKKSGAILDSLFAGHWTLSEYCKDKGDYRFIQLGRWYDNFDKDRARRLIGRSPKDFADTTFGASVAESLKTVSSTSSPMTQRVRALVRWADRPMARYDYSRLYVPVSSSKRRLLLSAAVIH